MDLAEAGSRVCRCEDDVGLVGYGGLEGDGSDRLLRSLVVKADRRGCGLGGAILTAVERAAADEGATSLYLPTPTADPFFRRHGCETAERTVVPAGTLHSGDVRELKSEDGR